MEHKDPSADKPPLSASGRTPTDDDLGKLLRKLLMPLASLKLTVVLLGMAIFIVFAGTLAQTEKDIWEVIEEYFRTAFAWIDFQIFFPKSFFPPSVYPRLQDIPGGFYFPGGWLIGSLMGLNLFAAHGLRFKVQAKGQRLLMGLIVIALGAGLTWVVVASGSNKDGVQGVSMIEWSTLWTLIKVGLAACWITAAAGLVFLPKQKSVEWWCLVGLLAVLTGALGWMFTSGGEVLTGPSMRILWQLIKGGLASLLLLGGCIMVFKKRAGVVLLHAGIGLVMIHEIIVGTKHIEAQMQIDEGQTVNYVQDIRSLEFAVIDRSGEDKDQVTVVPESLLLNSGTAQEPISNELLPFDVELVKFIKNSTLRPVKSDDKNLATAGAGKQFFAEEVRAGTGTDSGGQVDVSAAYVRLTSKDDQKDLGTYLVGLELSMRNLPEQIEVGDKQYEIDLRFKRTYKTYSMRLIDVRKDDYLGTNTPKNYSSDLQLVDETHHEDREVKVWMNNPLRYVGETFYQSGYFKNPRTGIETTTLQVVTNTGWMIPYVACMIVATGMLAHFWIILLRFLKRRSLSTVSIPLQDKPSQAEAEKDHSPGGLAVEGRLFGRYGFPFLIVLLAAAVVGRMAQTPPAPIDDMRLEEFGKLPVVYEGRVKPLDTLARNSLRIISGKESFKDEEGNRHPPIRWLLDVITGSEDATKHPVFRIENLEVLDTLGLQRRKRFRYAIDEFREQLQEFDKQSKLARETDPGNLSIFQKKILELDKQLRLYSLIQESFRFPLLRPESWQSDLQAEIARRREFAKFQLPHPVPPQTDEEKWKPYTFAVFDALAKKMVGEEANPATILLAQILSAYQEGDAKKFNTELDHYQDLLVEKTPVDLDLKKTRFEWFFNHFSPFILSAWMYVAAFVLACLSWLGWSKPLSRASFWLIALTLAVHTFALVSRIYISGRPPVTNLYSSAVFIGWGCVVLAMIQELIYRLGIGNIIASVIGFATLLIAHFLAGDGDTFVVLQAVLDTQFWLATHVTCITLGYSTTFMAGGLGIIYILRGILTPSLTPKIASEVNRMIYGTLCFAIFFSFVGTVLGGLWADDSWGRFWGWDPKENGALMIVLWNALVLHARWGGMIGQRGLAILAIVGNMVTAWSWFGVNELGVGLHAYGFTEGVLNALMWFCVSQCVIIGVSWIPQDSWWSSRRHADRVDAEVIV